MNKLIVIIFVAIMLSPCVSAEMINIHAYKTQQSQDDKLPLVEWFHGPNDKEIIKELEQMESQNQIHLIHWRTGAESEGGGWPGDEANIRVGTYMNFLGTGMAINGVMINNSNLSENLGNRERPKEIFPMTVKIQIKGNVSPDSILITAEFSSPVNLSSHTQIHAFLIETDAVDNHGRFAKNLLRDWTVDSSFSGQVGILNNWSLELTPDHLVGAGINISDINHLNQYEIIIAVIGGINGSNDTNILSLSRTQLPTNWQSMDSSAALVPMLLFLTVLSGLIFLIIAEKEREKSLPTLEGKWIIPGKQLQITVTAGNVNVDLSELEFEGEWRTSERIRQRRIFPQQSFTTIINVRGRGPFYLRLPISTETLGDWILDLKLPLSEATD